MAHTFKLYNSTSTGATIDFMDSNHGVVSYTPGYDYSGAPEITETAIIRIGATTSTGLNTAVQNLTRALQESRDKFERNYSTLNYIYFGYNGIDVGRSPLRRGAIVALAEPMGTAWANHELDATVEFTRSNYWEATSAVALTLTNDNSTGATTLGTLIYNNCDMDGTKPTEHENWVKVSPVGDMPAPPDISLKSTGLSTISGIAKVFITQFYQYSGESTTGWTAYGWYEGEDASTAAQSTGATYSNSAYQNFTISTAAAGTNITWAFDTDIRTDWNHVLIGARFNGTVTIKPYYSINSIATYGETKILTGDTDFHIYDCGIMQIPTKLAGVAPNLTIGINVIWSAGGTFALDWLQVTPINSMLYANTKYGDGTNRIAIIGDRYYSYSESTAAALAGITAAEGSLSLQPGLTNWLFVKWSNSPGTYKDIPIANARIRVLYRPRWRFMHDS